MEKSNWMRGFKLKKSQKEEITIKWTKAEKANSSKRRNRGSVGMNQGQSRAYYELNKEV